MIIGSGGAGKSTLAKQLGEILNLPVYHLDSFFWKANWVETDQDDWAALQEKLCVQSTWILDGNYSATMNIRLHACDTVIFLDFPSWLCLYRVVKRFFQYRGTSRPDMTQGCQERLTPQFLLWIWNYSRTKRPQIMAKLEAVKSEKQVIVLRSPQEANQYVSSCRIS